jgi:hypothetical protein
MLRWEFLRSNRHIRFFLPLHSFRIRSTNVRAHLSPSHAYTSSGHPHGKYFPAVGLPRRRRESDRPLGGGATPFSARKRGNALSVRPCRAACRQPGAVVDTISPSSCSCDRVHGESPSLQPPFRFPRRLGVRLIVTYGVWAALPVCTMTSPRLFAFTSQAKQTCTIAWSSFLFKPPLLEFNDSRDTIQIPIGGSTSQAWRPRL